MQVRKPAANLSEQLVAPHVGAGIIARGRVEYADLRGPRAREPGCVGQQERRALRVQPDAVGARGPADSQYMPMPVRSHGQTRPCPGERLPILRGRRGPDRSRPGLAYLTS